MSRVVDGNLWLVTGQVPWCVLFCPLCIPAVLPLCSSAQQHPKYDWAALRQYFQFNKAWLISICFAICNTRQFTVNNQCIGTIIGVIHQGKKIVPRGVEFLPKYDSPVSIEVFHGSHNVSYFYWQHTGGLGGSSFGQSVNICLSWNVFQKCQGNMYLCILVKLLLWAELYVVSATDRAIFCIIYCTC